MIIVVAISRDGFITKGSDSDPTAWTSKEDQGFFADIKSKHRLFVMGSTTYELNDVQPTDGALRVVLTNTPEKYESNAHEGQLEFYSISPQGFVDRYESRFESCLVLGGSYVYTEFMKAGVIDEIYLTVEPVNHGLGVPFLGGGNKLSDFNPIVKEEKILNKQGTKLIHYVLKK